MAFNWGSVDWGSVANAAVSYYGANQAASAAKSAGKTAAAGSDAAAQLGRDQFAYQQQINAPFLQSQYNALNQYNALMGLPTVGGQGGGLFSPQGQMTGAAAPTQWFGSSKGVTPNQQLYASDPRYKAAWDSIAADQQRHYGTGFNNNSTQKGWLGSLQEAYNAQPAPQAQMQQSGPAMTQQQAFDAFRNTPGYQFGMDQGRKALESSAAASGGLFSGKAGKALTQYGQNYADQQGFTPYMNRIASAAGIGQVNPVGNLQNASSNFASGVGQNMANSAQSRASGLMDASQARLWGLGQAGGFLNNAYGYYQNGGGR